MNKLIIFDMDGVLINVSSSYRECVGKTASIFLLPCINSELLPHPLFDLAELAFLKATGSLNNDWDLTHKVLTLMFSKINGKKESANREEWDVKELASFLKSSDKPLELLFKDANTGVGPQVSKEIDFFYKGDVGSGNIIKQIFQELYLGKELFSEIHGIQAQYYFEQGLILTEKLFIERDKLLSLSDSHNLAIATGRPAAEAAYAVKKNNINFFEKMMTHDDCVKEEKNRGEKTSLGKPHPFMLDTIAAYYESRGELTEKIYYIGDITDDMIAAKRSKYGFCAVGVTYSSPDKKKALSTLTEAGADYIVNTPQELIDFLK